MRKTKRKSNLSISVRYKDGDYAKIDSDVAQFQRHRKIPEYADITWDPLPEIITGRKWLELSGVRRNVYTLISDREVAWLIREEIVIPEVEYANAKRN
jgi:hypothetical protein|tara:strand:+ start:1674 stop:1967 length:294 start_codon:yes stop_codon:yes gene_type:complete